MLRRILCASLVVSICGCTPTPAPQPATPLPGSATSTTAQPAAPAPASKAAETLASGAGVNVKIPATWKSTPIGDYFVVHPTSVPMPATLTFARKSIPANLDPTQIMENFMKGAAITILSVSEMKIGGNPAIRILGTNANSPNAPADTVAYQFLVGGRNVHLIVGKATKPEEFKQYEAEFDRIVGSLTLSP